MTLLLSDVELHRHPRALHIRSATALAVTSSAVVGSELPHTRHIVNMGVSNRYSGDHVGDLHEVARELHIDEPFVGMLTAARLEMAYVAVERRGDVSLAVVATVGLSQPTAAGRTRALPDLTPPPGTINIVLLIDGRVPPSARVNAVITATEAKTLALFETDVRTVEGFPATGTGTDAIVVASTERGKWLEYSGPLTPIGELIGDTVRQAVSRATTAWRTVVAAQ